MTRRRIAYFLLALLLVALPCELEAKADPDVSSLNPNARQIFLASMEWGDRYFDPHTHFLRAPDAGSEPSTSRPALRFMVRESSWYALGLLLRNRKGDHVRALEILNAVLAQQYDEPGKPWNGAFRRSPEEPEPPANAVMWQDYDPNWREFIGTTFAMILEEYPDRIPPALARRLNDSIVLAVAGEIGNRRLVPTYTNPALMYGFLWNYAAVRNHRADWIAQSTAWQETVYNLFRKYNAFDEYNSPTYSGVDLYALGLWRSYGSTPHMRAMGSEMEAGLWRNLAAFYNANLRNISGPFDRAYGMDMESYVSIVGLALRTVLETGMAPFPELKPPVDHVGDLWFAPQFAILGVRIPSDAMSSFRSFQGERLVRRRINGQRVATAWIGAKVMYGGEITGKTKAVGFGSQFHQFHPVTIQWSTPSGKIGWIRLMQSPELDAEADKSSLKISCSGNVTFRIHAEGISATSVKQMKWALPGLVVHIVSDAKGFDLAPSGPQAVDASYSHITHMTLAIDKTSDYGKLHH